MDKSYSESAAAGCQSTPGQGGGVTAPAAVRTGETLRCGTLVLTGFPAPPPKEKAAPSPAAPGKGRPATATV